MARRGGRVEEYDYEERAYYERDTPAPARARPAQVRARDLLEIDVNTRRERSRSRQPDILRADYGRTEGQDLVLRKREVETFRPVRRTPPRARSPSVERERVRTRVVERERERSPSPERERVRTTTRTVERERERSPEPERVRTRIVEREQDRSYSPAGERTRTRIVERDREKDRARGPRESSIERTRTTTRTVERERERSPSPVRERIRTRVVERERQRSVSSQSSESDIVDHEPPIIRAPPIHQEVITHHRHIDHGYEYRPAPTPPPPLRQPRPRDLPKETETEIDIYKGRGETEIDIHTSTKRGGREEGPRERRPPREFYDDDILVERNRDRLHVRESHKSGRRSASARRNTIGTRESEEQYYARKTAERARIGEAYNGATKDWEIIDVPPGTERVRMDGVGGGAQEITWQRYNGVRRSKFIPERDSMAVYDRERDYEEVTDRRLTISMPPRNKYGDMWTEITKDLVVGEAIEEFGYDYEETEYFFYVMQYLKYEDVQELVFLSDDIRKARRERIRDMTYERERMKERELREIEYRRERERPELFDDERIIEREIVYDSGSRRPRGYR